MILLRDNYMRHIVLLLLFIILQFSSAFAANENSSQKIKLGYKAYWGGFVISNVLSSGTINQDNYQAEVSYNVTGMATIFSNMKNKTFVKGNILPDGELRPLVFKNEGGWSKYHYKNSTLFDPDNGRVKSHLIDFKFKRDAEYIPIKKEQAFGPDMLSFYLGLSFGRDKLSQVTETVQQTVFDGFFLIDISYKCYGNKTLKSKRSTYQGPVLVCEFKDKIIDGRFIATDKKKKKKRKKKKSDKPKPVYIWYAQVGDLDALMPVYAEFSIGWGKVRVYLTEAEVINTPWQGEMP